ncbi:MAG TPA: site-2 protease family protein [Acidimicrobiales bacterium]
MDPRKRILILVVGGAVLGWLLLRDGTLDRTDAIIYGSLVPSVILHEVSHGVVALGFGDDTAKRAGRLTLNPIPHIDPFWTVLMPGLMLLTAGAAIGMAKPVPVNPAKMRSPRNNDVVVALAGPATNIALALIAGLFIRAGARGLAGEILLGFGLVNVWLAAFNLIPLPPLDGSAVIERLLPDRWLASWFKFRQYSFLVLFALFFLAGDLFDRWINPAVDLWFRFLV